MELNVVSDIAFFTCTFIVSPLLSQYILRLLGVM
jgi:hypothetical protein